MIFNYISAKADKTFFLLEILGKIIKEHLFLLSERLSHFFQHPSLTFVSGKRTPAYQLVDKGSLDNMLSAHV